MHTIQQHREENLHKSRPRKQTKGLYDHLTNHSFQVPLEIQQKVNDVTLSEFPVLSLNFPVYFKIEIEKIFKLTMKCLLFTGFYRLLFITKSSTMGGTDEDRDAIRHLLLLTSSFASI